MLASIYSINMSCSQNKKIDIKTSENFPATFNLSHQTIHTEPKLYAVGGLLLMDSVLITIDMRADTFFQAFKLPAYNNVGGFINKGDGPEEELFIDPFIQGISGNKFFYRDVSSLKTVDFNTHTNKLDLVEKIDLPEDLLTLCHIFRLGDNIIGCKFDEPTNKEFVAYNIKTKDIFDFGPDFPSTEKNIKPLDKNKIFVKANTVKPDGSAFASVYDKFPIIRIYSNKGELKSETYLENNQVFPDALTANNPTKSSVNEIMQNYRIIKSSNNFIYSLYIGKTVEEMPVGLNDFSNEIHVWDWEGTAIMKILLDKKIFTFDVDPNDDYLLCSSLESLDELYKYELNETFQNISDISKPLGNQE